MCGISGFNWKDETQINQMSTTTAHRGPDATGFFCEEGISFGHNRLSIIDLTPSANQPMFDYENNFVIIFNGEIFNFKELKIELKDYNFKTKSDTEVILAGYKKWGKDVVSRLNGQFALAIWDKSKKELFIARDRSGIVPLYYFWDGTRFIFASEVKAILTHNIPRKLNLEAFNHYMRVLYVPSPMTMIMGIMKLKPGHTLTLSGLNLSIESYIKGDITETHLSYEDAKKELRSKTINAVRRQLVSDVPVGVYLSGGIDSSAVLFAMSQSQKNIKTFSVGFELPDKDDEVKFNHDFELARKTAKFFGVDHHPLMMSQNDVVKIFNEMIEQCDDPISNPTAIAMMYLARQAKKEVTVVLTGNGGDELFGGYERYRLALLSSYYKKLPAFIRNILNANLTLRKLDSKEDIDLYARLMFEKDDKLAPIISKSIFRKDFFLKEYFFDNFLSRFGGDIVERFMETDRASWLTDQALTLSDKMSMRSAIEERVPLLDNELITFANSLPRNYKVTTQSTKKIFKDAFRNDLPNFLFKQPKRGWFAPGAKWLRFPKMIQMTKEIFTPSYYSETESMFEWKELNKMHDKHVSGEEYNLVPIWAALTFQAWAKKYKITV